MTKSRIENIVYIAYAPLSAKIAKDFFINDLIHEKVKVEYWDFTHYFFNSQISGQTLYKELTLKVNSLAKFDSLLKEKNNDATVYIVIFPFTSKVLRLFRVLTKNHVKTVIISRGMLPTPASPAIGKSLLRIFRPGMLKKARNFIFSKLAVLLKQSGFIKTFDRIYYTGEDAIKLAGFGYQVDKQKAELIPVNSADYDHYLTLNTAPDLVGDKYAVFLDEYLPYHPDVMMLGLQTVTANEYYHALNNFFDEIESKFGCKVVIAAHPKAELYHNNNYFNNREIFFSKSAQLVKHAEFVLAHQSTSISFAVLFRKKLLFLYTDYMVSKMDYYVKSVSHFADVLGAECIDITSKEPKANVLEIDQNKYNEYICRYLSSKETQDTFAVNTFIKSLEI
jgi:hypothetical protein